MKTLLNNKSTIFILVLAVFIVASVFAAVKDVEATVRYLFVGCGIILTVGLLFFNLKWYYLILVGLIPISVNVSIVGGAQLNFPSEGMLVLMLPILFLFNRQYRIAFTKLIKHPIAILLIIDLFLALVSTLFSSHIDISLKRFIIRFIFISGFFIVLSLIQKKEDLGKLWFFYALGLIPVMYHTITHHASFSFDLRAAFFMCQPYYDEHTVYGACLAFIIPFLFLVIFNPQLFRLTFFKYIFILILLVIIIISELLALSRAAILSLLIAFSFNLLLRYKLKFKTFVIGVVIFIGLGVIFQNEIYDRIQKNDSVSNDGKITNHFSSITNVESDASNLERINRWICAYRMFEERPFLGYGPGTYQFEYNQFQTIENKTRISTSSGNKGNAHSEYLTYLSEMGIIGFITFLLTMFTSIFYGMENYYNVKDHYLKVVNLGTLLGVITFYFHGIFNSFLDQSKMAFLYFSALGIIVWINQYWKKREDFE